MYSIYTTEGWVLGGVNVGENNRYIDLFTKELGLVRGVAQGVRKLESKLRYGLQDLSYSRLSLIKGREVWRIVNVEKLPDFEDLAASPVSLKLSSRIFLLIRRLVKGEEKDVILFNDISLALKLAGGTNISEEILKNLETILVYRVLDRLGYIPENKQLGEVSIFVDWTPEFLKIGDQIRLAMIRQINDSLAHTHL